MPLPSHIPLLALFQIDGLFFHYCCCIQYICLYIHIPKYTNTTCSICIMLLVCMFPEPTIWFWLSNLSLYLQRGLVFILQQGNFLLQQMVTISENTNQSKCRVMEPSPSGHIHNTTTAPK